MIIAYSTIPGYASLRDHNKGTWFLQSLVEVFMTHAHDTELVDLLRMTSERLSQFTNEMVTLVKRTQSVPPCNPEKVERMFLIPPRKVKECFQINQ